MTYNISPNIYPFTSSGTLSTSSWVLEANLFLWVISAEPLTHREIASISKSQGCLEEWECESESHSVVSDSLSSHGLYPTRLLRPWNFPGKSTGVGCNFLLQGIFRMQELKPSLPHYAQTLYHLSHQEWEAILKEGANALQKNYTLNQSILKEISPKYTLEGLMLKLKLQYFGHLMQRASSLEKTLMLGKIESRRKRGWQRMRWLDSITDSVNISLRKLWVTVLL